MRATETIYREMLSAYAKRRGGQLQEDCDLSVRLWAAAAQIQALEAQAGMGAGDRAFPGRPQGSIWTGTEPCEASSDRHPAEQPDS